MLIPVTTNVWAAEGETQLPGGFLLPNRMTILRLSNNDLMVISPNKVSLELIEEIKHLGTVKYIIAPNGMHHLFFKKFFAHFPQAQTWGPSDLHKKREDIKFSGNLSDSEIHPWKNEVEAFSVRAEKPLYEEVIFFHKSSGTLVVTDLLFNLQSFPGMKEKLLAKVNGTYKKLAVSKLAQRVFTNPIALRGVLGQLEKWQPKTLVMGHGSIVYEDVVSQTSAALKKIIN